MIVLILGSGPNVTACRNWPRAPFNRIVAINNAWAVRPDWDILIHPDDFPEDRWPDTLSPGQQVIRADSYVAHQNRYGGFVYAGGTMAFTAGYWALSALSPRVIGFLGCDMVYPRGPATHFYGQGAPDPLREDISLRSLEAKSARMRVLAARQGCAMVNLSTEDSRLQMPHARRERLADATPAPWDAAATEEALAEEDRLDYRVPSGKYWKEEDRFDPAAIDALDALWLRAARPGGTAL